MFSPDPFFIGWAKKPPAALRGFLVLAAATLVIGFAIAGMMVGASQADPEGGGFRFDFGEVQLEGTLIAAPYPMLWLDEGAAPQVARRMIMLNGNGKTGVADRASAFDGSRVVATGVLLERGELQMLQVDRSFEAVTDAPAQEPGREDLEVWRLTGEICDGRCYVGAMRPGEGIAHKACANLCISGRQPPVFVAQAPVEGTSFMLMGASDYGPLPEEVLDFTGTPVQLEGRLERIGDLTILLIDPDSLEVL